MLEKAIGQSWLDGMKSSVAPLFNDGRDVDHHRNILERCSGIEREAKVVEADHKMVRFGRGQSKKDEEFKVNRAGRRSSPSVGNKNVTDRH